MSIHEEMRRQGLPRIPGKRETLHHKSLEYRTGDITKEELLAYLNREIRRGEEILDEFSEKRLDQELLIFTREVRETGLRGVAAEIEALKMMREWADSPQKALLDTALALALQGDTLLNDALQAGFELSITLDEANCELLQALGVDPFQ